MEIIPLFLALIVVSVGSYVLWHWHMRSSRPVVDVTQAVLKLRPALSRLAQAKFQTQGRGFVVLSSPDLYIGRLSYMTGEPEGMAFGYFSEDKLALVAAKKYRYEKMRQVKALIADYDPKEGFVLIRILPGMAISTSLVDHCPAEAAEEGDRMLAEAHERFKAKRKDAPSMDAAAAGPAAVTDERKSKSKAVTVKGAKED